MAKHFVKIASVQEEVFCAAKLVLTDELIQFQVIWNTTPFWLEITNFTDWIPFCVSWVHAKFCAAQLAK